MIKTLAKNNVLQLSYDYFFEFFYYLKYSSNEVKLDVFFTTELAYSTSFWCVLL